MTNKYVLLPVFIDVKWFMLKTILFCCLLVEIVRRSQFLDMQLYT